MIDWPSYSRSLVRRGEILFSYDFLDTWDSELARMNENRKGRPFAFPSSFILVIGYIRICFHLTLRTNRGHNQGNRKVLTKPSKLWSHVQKDFSRMNVDITGIIRIDDDDDDDDIRSLA